MNLSKEQYIELIKTLEIRNLAIGLEVSLDNDFRAVEITDKQHAYIMSFEQLQHEIYRQAKTYDLEDSFEVHPDTSLLVLKTDTALHDMIFDAIDKHEKAITYEMLVRHVVIQKAQQLKKKHAPDALQFSQLNPIIQAITEKLYTQLSSKGLSSILRKDIDTVKNIKIMEQVFKQFSEIAIKLGEMDFTEAQIKNNTIGNQPATEEAIKKVEQKLNITLPEDYKQLMLITNGFAAPNETEPSFLPIEEIDYLKNMDDTELIESYSIEGIEETGQLLAQSILVGGLGEEQHFLLIPPNTKSKQWQYWKFANWIPGEEPYENLKNYLQEVSEFNLEMLKN